MQRVSWIVGLLAVVSAGPLHAEVSPVGRRAVESAERGAERSRGGFFRHTWHVATRTVLAGAIGGGAGYYFGGPALAMDWGTKAAGGGAALSSMTGAGRSGVFKRSNRCFAKADLAQAKGQVVRKHFYKLEGIVWSGVECGVVNALTSGGIGCLTGGPAAVVPAATTGAIVGGACGVVVGATKAYVVPFFKRRSLGWSMHRAGRALKKLAREPQNPAWQGEVQKQLRRVRDKKERIPRLGWGQARRYQRLAEQARELSRQPGLAGLATALR
jgi:hypothetical protein